MFFAKKRFCSDKVTILFGIELFVRIFEYGADSESENNLLKAMSSEVSEEVYSSQNPDVWDCEV